MEELLGKYPELTYIAILFGLFVVPRGLERWGVPTAITSLGIGALVGPGLGLLQHDPAIPFLAGLGIVALFLFAGLEVDVAQMSRRGRAIGTHLATRIATLAGTTWIVVKVLHLDARAALLVALAVMTPSAGFILDSVPKLGLSDDEKDWVTSMCIATELLALSVLFVVMNSFDLAGFVVAAGVMTIMVLALPWVFRGFASAIAPSPQTDFVFLLIVALTAALITRLLGAYYLVGAFVVGLVTQRVRTEIPDRFSGQVIETVQFFAAFFVPFYFFKAGLHLERDAFTPHSLAAGLILVAVAVPWRVGGVVLYRRVVVGEPPRVGLRIAMTLLPTLVFTLVISDLLAEQFEAPHWLIGGLVIYTLVNTVIPSVFFRESARNGAPAPVPAEAP